MPDVQHGSRSRRAISDAKEFAGQVAPEQIADRHLIAVGAGRAGCPVADDDVVIAIQQRMRVRADQSVSGAGRQR
jgi:hypothetical protein